MSFNSDEITSLKLEGTNAILIFNSSCQALIEANITPVSSNWFDELNIKLNQIQRCIIDWRRGGFLYFYNDNLMNIIGCGQSFMKAKPHIDKLLEILKKEITSVNKAALITALNEQLTLIAPIVKDIDAYKEALKVFEDKIMSLHESMKNIIAHAQQEEATIKFEISNINNSIKKLENSIKHDQDIIAKSKNSESQNIIETDFNILFAPFTGGTTLISTGFAVSSIVSVENEVSNMHQNINKLKKDIISNLNKVSSDKQSVSILQILLPSVNVVFEHITSLVTCLDNLKIGWHSLQKEMNEVIIRINRAENYETIITAQIWINSVNKEWESIIRIAQTMLGICRKPVVKNKIVID